MPEERVAKFIAARIEQARGETRFAAMRKRLGLSQRELTHRSGVSLRSIQMREQRNKDINRAQACSAAALFRVPHCTMEDLLEIEVADAAMWMGSRTRAITRFTPGVQSQVVNPNGHFYKIKL